MSTSYSSRLRTLITRRSHLLNLFSQVFLLALTLALALRPGRWLHPWKKQRRRPGALEGIYITWAYSTFFNVR